MKKLVSLALSLILALSLSATAFAANYGTVTVNSRHNDNSINQVTLNANTGWTASNGVTLRGTFYITFPKGTQYQLPSAEQCWRIVADTYYGAAGNTGGYEVGYNGYGYGDYILKNGSYVYVGTNNGDYVRNNNGSYTYVGLRAGYYNNNGTTVMTNHYNGAGYGEYVYQNGSYVYVGSGNGDYTKSGAGYKWVGYNTTYGNNQSYNNNNNNSYSYGYAIAPAPSYNRTTSQQAAENQFADLRKYGENYGWSVDWRPSTTTTATSDTCWYRVDCSRPTSNTETTYFSFSVYTEKSGSSYSTRFKVFENGNQVGSYTLAEIENLLKQYGANYGTLPCNVFKTTTASAAADSMLSYLRSNRGFSVSATSNGYANDSGSSNLVLSRSGYADVVVRLMVDKTTDGWFRCTFARNGENLTTLELLTLFK